MNMGRAAMKSKTVRWCIKAFSIAGMLLTPSDVGVVPR